MYPKYSMVGYLGRFGLNVARGLRRGVARTFGASFGSMDRSHKGIESLGKASPRKLICNLLRPLIKMLFLSVPSGCILYKKRFPKEMTVIRTSY